MDSLKKLNVGVVGIGRIGQRHALNILNNTPRANLLCACSTAEPDLIWGKKHLSPYGVKLFDSFEDMIKMPGLEAVVIASISALHMPHTIAALERGNSYLIERVEAKPETKLMVGFTRRFDESYQDARLKIQEGKIGKPTIVRSQGCERVDTSPFFRNYLKNSGGIFIDAIVHDIDLALLFFGEESRPKSVSAAGVAAIHTELSEVGDADNAVGICEFWGGKIAFFYNSRMAAHGYDNMTEIFGTRGKLSINLTPRQNQVEMCDSDGYIKTEPTTSWYDRYKTAFVMELVMWVDALDEKPMPIPLRSSLTGLIIANALQESLRTDQRIRFERDGKRKDSAADLS
ncbi:NAD-binding Rossmann fold oxidoreductase family protein [Dactylonectria macrodidyma]|uniref:NAD-binding Rossmann fold oxidoreductase family protein n=1 Tax=Dactylonectria macrodidyma TaxID=307937 RepID=A0A9P9FVZ1_9HYPO|nr:NAD-binding Rossmann fold oxidoreductase family protein [Dactylonectria macrodidyma]